MALNGPRARDILSACTDADLSNAAFPWLTAQEIDIAGRRLWALRMSYAGELGWEMHGEPAAILAAFRALKEAGKAHGLVNYGSFAMNAMRMEKAYKGAGELTNEVTLPEADVMRFVKLDKQFRGKAATVAATGRPLEWVCVIWRSPMMGNVRRAWRVRSVVRRGSRRRCQLDRVRPCGGQIAGLRLCVGGHVQAGNGLAGGGHGRAERRQGAGGCGLLPAGPACHGPTCRMSPSPDAARPSTNRILTRSRIQPGSSHEDHSHHHLGSSADQPSGHHGRRQDLRRRSLDRAARRYRRRSLPAGARSVRYRTTCRRTPAACRGPRWSIWRRY